MTVTVTVQVSAEALGTAEPASATRAAASSPSISIPLRLISKFALLPVNTGVASLLRLVKWRRRAGRY